MSTDSTNQPDPTPGVVPGQEGVHPAAGSPAGAAYPAGSPAGEPTQPKRNTALLIAAMVAVLVAAIAIAGLILWRGSIDDANAETEAAFTRSVTEQGAEVTTVECEGDTCAAIIGGQAYTVLVQTDEQGEQQFGVAAYSGD
ncbi:hypothetical protein GCU60_18165 [Blastococcus saxobsidens]|uniref:DUF4333 domain-containing protein n=1 Tax=Blastococcus saxobsidens TaxID=138336 RepID=A0A6L9W6I7_9ACTN|nr:hypothetical protein [Blastococcus saxobsidens]NEK87667.1 hypothetical protein [Blastococcus saxobsidens]